MRIYMSIYELHQPKGLYKVHLADFDDITSDLLSILLFIRLQHTRMLFV